MPFFRNDGTDDALGTSAILFIFVLLSLVLYLSRAIDAETPANGLYSEKLLGERLVILGRDWAILSDSR